MTLAEWRKQRGLTQAEVGKMLGCGAQMVSEMERGNRGGSLRTIDKVAKITNGAVTRADWPAVKPRG